jgi:hypothetical protein
MRTTNNLTRVPVALLALFLLTFTAGAHSISQQYVLTQNQSQSIEIPNQGLQENSSHSALTFTLVRKDGGAFDVTFTDAEATGTAPNNESIVGVTASLKLDGKGEITESTGLEDNPYVLASGGVAVMNENLQGLFLVLPEVKLKPNVKWSRETDIPSEQNGLSLRRKVHEVFKIERTIDFGGTPAFEISSVASIQVSGGGNQGGQELDVELEGTLNATIVASVESGIILQSESSGKMTGFIGLPTASLPVTMNLELSLKQKE